MIHPGFTLVIPYLVICMVYIMLIVKTKFLAYRTPKTV